MILLVMANMLMQPWSMLEASETKNHAGRAKPGMKDDNMRLGSFAHVSLPIGISSIMLADNGFYFDKMSKKIVCAHCEFFSDIPKHMGDLVHQHCVKEQTTGRYGQQSGNQTNGVTKRWPTPRPQAAKHQRLSSSGDELFDEEESINDNEMYESGPQMSGSLPELSRLDLYRSNSVFGGGRSTPTYGETGNPTATSMGECSVPVSSFLSLPASATRSTTIPGRIRPIFDARNAKIKGFETYEARLSTFDLWPVGKRPTKEELADCGFFFITDDMCQCFNCELILHKWQENDDVWRDHAKHSSDCEYILFRKGEDFVTSVRNEVNAPGFPGERTSQRRDGSVAERGSESQIAPEQQVERRDVTARLDMEIVRLVMSLGYSEDEVGSVIQERLMETGKDFQNMTEMVKVLDDIRNKSRPPPSIQFHRRLADSHGTNIAVVSNPGSLSYSSRDVESHETPSRRTAPSPMDSWSNEEFQMEGHGQTTVKGIVPPSGPHVNSSGNLREINDENEDLQDRELCSICVDRDRDTVFVPCHHLICCHTCAQRLRECPICREWIADRLVINE